MSGRTIAMWSGPRNISTAMMRSFENRPDTDVIDEPLYAHYLQVTGIDHPGREEVLGSQSTDWREVAASLTRPVPAGRIHYQKHMAHHLTEDIDLAWTDDLTNVFLLRDPQEVVRSYTHIREAGSPEELGFPQQCRLFDRVTQREGRAPVVLESRRVLEDPRGALTALCRQLSIPYCEEMLAWPAGPRSSDGVWAPYWYANVEASTGFAPYRPRPMDLNPDQQELAALCQPFYDRLREHSLSP